jgi:hypothetical protein
VYSLCRITGAGYALTRLRGTRTISP